ncbi:MAG: DMT family transporter [Bacteroidales bacterium]|nr:DMT family transporter [Bacteroidales bacterium]
MTQDKTLKGYIAISFSMLFWGFSFVWSKQLLNAGFPVFTIVFFRLFLASVIFVTLFKIQGKLEKVRKGDWKKFLWLAFFEPFLYFIGEDFGLQQVSPSFASVIIALIPIVVSVTMYFAENEPLSWRLLLGAVISIFGIAVMTFGPDSNIIFNVKGLLWLLLALLAACGYSVLLARLVKEYSPITITTYQNLLAIPFYLPFVCIFDLRQWGEIIWSANAIFCLVCLAVLCSAGAYMLYSYAAKQISITKLTVFTNAIPIVTICGAAMLGQEALTSRKILGIFIVIAGVVLSQLRKTTTAP